MILSRQCVPIGALAVSLLFAIILMAIKEALLLGIDAVDILIADRADQKANIADSAGTAEARLSPFL